MKNRRARSDLHPLCKKRTHTPSWPGFVSTLAAPMSAMHVIAHPIMEHQPPPKILGWFTGGKILLEPGVQVLQAP